MSGVQNPHIGAVDPSRKVMVIGWAFRAMAVPGTFVTTADAAREGLGSGEAGRPPWLHALVESILEYTRVESGRLVVKPERCDLVALA